MAYICEKEIKCKDCPSYRFSEVDGRFVCFAQEDEELRKETEEVESGEFLFEIQFTGHYLIKADNEDEAMEKFIADKFLSGSQKITSFKKYTIDEYMRR